MTRYVDAGQPMWGKRRLKRSVPCGVCGSEFMQFPHGRPRFCSVACSRESASRRFSRQVVRKCLQCGGEFKAVSSPSRAVEKRDRYCSKACGWKARNKQRTKPCVRCGEPVTLKPSDEKFHAKKYCSHECYWQTIRESEDMRRAPKKDANHNEIAELFEKSGFGVYDTSATGRGCPDMVVWFGQVLKMIEIKNPKTSYGRKGLSPSQKRLVEGRRFPVSVITGIDEAQEFIRIFKGFKSDRERNEFLYPKEIAELFSRPEQLEALKEEMRGQS